MQAFLPETYNPARSMAGRQARRCFEQVDILLEDLRASPTAAEKPSPAVDTTSSWFFCPHAKSLIQLDPAVLAFAYHANALQLSPLFAADDGEEKDDWDIDAFLDGIFFGGESPLCAEAKSDANGGGLEAVDACFYVISDKVISQISNGDGSDNDTDDNGNIDGVGQGSLHPGEARLSVSRFQEARHVPAPAVDPSPSPFADDARHRLPLAMGDSSPSPIGGGSSFEAVPQRKLRGTATKDKAGDIVLARAHRALAADEPLELEAFIVASALRYEEIKARQKEEEEEGDDRNSFARTILGVMEDVAVYVGDLLVVSPWLFCSQDGERKWRSLLRLAFQTHRRAVGGACHDPIGRTVPLARA